MCWGWFLSKNRVNHNRACSSYDQDEEYLENFAYHCHTCIFGAGFHYKLSRKISLLVKPLIMTQKGILLQNIEQNVLGRNDHYGVHHYLFPSEERRKLIIYSKTCGIFSKISEVLSRRKTEFLRSYFFIRINSQEEKNNT
jgi:hypothetical protein